MKTNQGNLNDQIRHDKLRQQILKWIKSNYNTGFNTGLLLENTGGCGEGTMALNLILDTNISLGGCTPLAGPSTWFNGEATWEQICSGGEFIDSDGDWWDLDYFLDLFTELPDESNACACLTENLNTEGCGYEPIYGCTDPNAPNFDPNANIDNNSCQVDSCLDFNNSSNLEYSNETICGMYFLGPQSTLQDLINNGYNVTSSEDLLNTPIGNEVFQMATEYTNNGFCCLEAGINSPLPIDCNAVTQLDNYQFNKFCTKCEEGGYIIMGPQGSLNSSYCPCCEGDFQIDVPDVQVDPLINKDPLVKWGCHTPISKFCLPLSPDTVFPPMFNLSISDISLYDNANECAINTSCSTSNYGGSGNWLSSLPWPETMSEERKTQKQKDILTEILQNRANIKK